MAPTCLGLHVFIRKGDKRKDSKLRITHSVEFPFTFHDHEGFSNSCHIHVATCATYTHHGSLIKHQVHKQIT